MRAPFIFLSTLLIAISSSARTSFPEIKFTKEELRQGRAIAQLAKGLRSNKIHTYLAKRLHRQMNSTMPAFLPYKEWAEDLIKAARVNHLDNFNLCASVLDKKNNNTLYGNLNKYCYLKFLDLYRNTSSTHQKKHKKTLAQYLPYYLFPLKNSFIQFLNEIKDNKELSHRVSASILSAYKQKSQHPVNAKLLPHIFITANLTNYIQRTGLRDQSSKAFSQKKILSISRKIRSQKYLRSASRSQLSRDVQELINSSRRNNDLIDPSFARKIFIITGRKLISIEEHSLAKNCFKEALSLSTQSDYHDSLFVYLWPDILNKNYSQVNKIIDELDLHGKFDDLSSQLKFWIAYCSEKIGKKKLAEHYYNIIVKDNPVSYYSIMSIKRLKVISKDVKNFSIAKPSDTITINTNHPRENISPQEYSSELLLALKRIAIFTEIDQTSLISYENHHINNTPIQELIKNYSMYSKLSHNELREKITLNVASILHQEERYLKSFSIIYNGIKIGKNNINPEVLKTLFPSPYKSQIEDLAGASIDPYIILSLIRQESAFDPRAKSRVGARGLMQLMPGTARQIERKLTSQRLHNPKTNLKVGINYFIKLYNQYDKNLIYTLSAYNAGENRVKRWKKEYFKDHQPLHVIESIPFKETNLYVKLIFRNLFFYKLINGHKNDSETANKIFDVFITKG